SPQNSRLSLGGMSTTPESNKGEINPKEIAHSIIVSHLKEIKAAGGMSNTIISDDYWRKVFEDAKAPDMFDAGRDEISRALTAGLEPYHRGETLTAVQFAELALSAI